MVSMSQRKQLVRSRGYLVAVSIIVVHIFTQLFILHLFHLFAITCRYSVVHNSWQAVARVMAAEMQRLFRDADLAKDDLVES